MIRPGALQRVSGGGGGETGGGGADRLHIKVPRCLLILHVAPAALTTSSEEKRSSGVFVEKY